MPPSGMANKRLKMANKIFKGHFSVNREPPKIFGIYRARARVLHLKQKRPHPGSGTRAYETIPRYHPGCCVRQCSSADSHSVQAPTCLRPDNGGRDRRQLLITNNDFWLRSPRGFRRDIRRGSGVWLAPAQTRWSPALRLLFSIDAVVGAIMPQAGRVRQAAGPPLPEDLLKIAWCCTKLRRSGQSPPQGVRRILKGCVGPARGRPRPEPVEGAALCSRCSRFICHGQRLLRRPCGGSSQ
jgi:hypothetical protein